MKESTHGNFFLETDSYHKDGQDFDRFVIGWRNLELGWILNEMKVGKLFHKHFVIVLPWFRWEILHVDMRFLNEYLYIGPLSMKFSSKGDGWGYFGRRRLW